MADEMDEEGGRDGAGGRATRASPWSRRSWTCIGAAPCSSTTTTSRRTDREATSGTVSPPTTARCGVVLLAGRVAEGGARLTKRQLLRLLLVCSSDSVYSSDLLGALQAGANLGERLKAGWEWAVVLGQVEVYGWTTLDMRCHLGKEQSI